MRKYLVVLFVFWLLVGLDANVLGQAGTETDSVEKGNANLVAWWKLDESSGKEAEDASGHGHTGTLQGSASFDTQSVPGRIGRALLLKGDNGLLVITGFKGVTGTQPRTISVWLKTTGVDGEIVSWGEDDFGKQWTLGFVRKFLGVNPNGGYLYMKNNVSDDAWHHVVAVVKEGDPPNLYDHAALYVDGEPATIHDIGLLDLWPIDTGSDMDLRIGKGFSGLIDDLRIYDRALSREEVKALFNQK